MPYLPTINRSIASRIHLPRLSVLTLGILALAACGGASAPPMPSPSPSAPPASATPAEPITVQRPQDVAQLARGAQLYRQYCAVCHGIRAEGSPDWQGTGAGELPQAPPLDGSGHAWHHPMHVLHDMTKHGFRGMPAFEDQLTDQQIDDIIAWFQSLWPDALYQNWYRKDQRIRAGATGH